MEMKRPEGRPRIITPEKVQKLEEAFEWGCSDLEACLHADISKSTFYAWIKQNPSFWDRKEVLKKTPTIRARQSVLRGIESDSDLALKYLERKEKGEFSLRQEWTGKDGSPIETISHISDDQAQKLAKEYEDKLKELTLNNS